MNIKVGFGFDVHKLAEDETLFLGGVEVPHTKGTVAHSDGDVVIHALCDALLGAANLRDIGYQFPDTDEEFKNIDSRILLKRTIVLLQETGFEFGNADITIAMQQPKLKPHIPTMQRVLSQIVETSEDNMSIKATTTERLGFEGREEGVSAYATVLISKV